MHENIFERIHRLLTWKRIIAFNALLFLVLVVPLSVRLAQEDTENRSSAAEDANAPVVTPPPSYPSAPPEIDRVSQFFGKTGDTVVLIGRNFGDYQWGSHVYVGNTEAAESAIVRWSDTVLEVQIPESASTGRVYVDINGNQAQWDGTLLLTALNRSAQISIKKESNNQALIAVGNANGIIRGMIEIAHVGEPVVPSMLTSGSLSGSSSSVDSLGKKLKIEFTLSAPLSSVPTNLLSLQHPGIGSLEIIRVELYNANNQIVTVYSDPLTIKTL